LTVAVISTVPAACAGASIVHSVLDEQFTEVAFVVPKVNFVPVVPGAKPAPVTVTLVPPATGPPFGAAPDTAGANLYRSADVAALVPNSVVTLTWTDAAASAGVTAVIDVLEVTVKLLAATAPKLTDVTPVKFEPVIVTDVPPAAEPVFGRSFVIAGAGM
jgi:hypothetical protein